ncbi:MAG TPA: hypothetical protein VLJ62_23940, partial [Burkholderiaceae bacterium]|nr:hypothetical protein [Burkholderiaceae bacterium]
LQLAHIGGRLRAATQPRRLMSSALGLAGALLVMWWLRGRAPIERAKAAPLVSARPSAASRSWAHGLALAWPLLLPASWRARVSPATAATVVSLAAALVQRLLATVRGSAIDRSKARP